MKKRKEALRWWAELNQQQKDMHTPIERDSDSLTGREIQILFEEKNKTDSEFIEEAFKGKIGNHRSPFGMGS